MYSISKTPTSVLEILENPNTVVPSKGMQVSSVFKMLGTKVGVLETQGLMFDWEISLRT